MNQLFEDFIAELVRRELRDKAGCGLSCGHKLTGRRGDPVNENNGAGRRKNMRVL
jgi:hypothetical protein